MKSPKQRLLRYSIWVSSVTILFFLIIAIRVLADDNGPNTPVTTVNSEGSSVSIRAPQIDNRLYLDLSLPKTQMYLGERLPLKTTLYISGLLVNMVDEPVLDQPEFIFDKARNPIQKQCQINDTPGRMITFSYLITPVKAGVFALGPIKQRCYLVTENNFSKRRVMEVSSKKIILKVLPLPASGRPADFSGAVGQFQLSVSIASPRATQGEPITVELTVSGYGNLQTAAAPVLQNSGGLKAYSAEKVIAGSSRTDWRDQVTFEQTIIPLDNRLKQIGPYNFNFFDPARGRYRSLSSVIPVTIIPNPRFQMSAAGEDQSFLLKMAPLKKGAGGLYLKKQPLINQYWFWLVQAIPVLVFISAILYRRKQEILKSDSPKARLFQATVKAREELAAAGEFLAEGDNDQLVANLLRILKEYLGKRFDLPVAGMTATVVESLKNRGVKEEVLGDIRSFFEEYDQCSFTGASLTPERALRMQDLLKRIVNRNW
ncbi:MAG: hypothetical protein ACM3X9_02595 [Bacillota bacterium]